MDTEIIDIPVSSSHEDLDAQARAKGSPEIRSIADLRALACPELFAEEGELEEFLEFTYAERRRNLG